MRRSLIAVATILMLAAGCRGARVESSDGGNAPAEASPSATAREASPIVQDGEPWIAAQPHRQHLVLVRPDGTDALDILEDLPFEQFHPDWSPDGARLAFEHAPEGPDADIRDVWISDADGANAEPLLTEYPRGLEGLFWSNPAWSADGGAIVMVGYEGNAGLTLPARSVLAIVDIATRELSVVSEYESASNGNLHSNPRWSNDGTAIVFVLDHFRGDRYIGGAIAVIRGTDTGWTEPDLLTEASEFADHPDWHPTEDLVVFCTYEYAAFWDTDEPSNLYTIRPDGSDRVQLTTFGPGEDRATQPSWTSDGRVIFTYVSGEHDETQRPAFIDADGTGLEILDGLENLVYPRLQPTA